MLRTLVFLLRGIFDTLRKIQMNQAQLNDAIAALQAAMVAHFAATDALIAKVATIPAPIDLTAEVTAIEQAKADAEASTAKINAALA